MSHDYSRINHNPADDYLGVLLQQGRPLTDADWNALVAEVTRRVQAGTFDTLGPAVVPQTTPDAFLITPSGGSFTIGAGRIYVDGLLAENHGTGTLQWDAHLAEAFGQDAIPYASQPYLPDPPALPAAGPYLVCVDVWQREVGPLQDEQLLEKALGGVDTTARLQTVWQVRALAVGGSVDCGTPLDEIEGWESRTAPSAGRLTTDTGDVADDPNPCLVPPAGGYKGGENQLYRVEVHQGGPPGTATFKWSRDNASVQARVLRIPNATHLVVDSVGKDEVLRFNDGDWIEVLDDVNELSGDPGVLRRIVTGGGVDDASRTLTLEQALPPGRFPVDAQGVPTGDRHMRLRRWDQSGLVRRADGTTYADLDAAGSTGEITIPADATQLLLESGILVSFGVANAGGRFRNGDWWVFTARAVDASLEILEAAPPRGIHHHYAKLAVVTPPHAEDCRVHWPPGGCCTFVVYPGESIQAAIDSLPESGGCVCLKTGLHIITRPIEINRSGVILHGESPGVIVRSGGEALPHMLVIGDGDISVHDVEVMMIDFELATPLPDAIIVLLQSCSRVGVHQCAMRYTGSALSNLVGTDVSASTDVQLTSNAIERCYVGILAEGHVRGLLIEHNTLRGPLYAISPDISFIFARYGVRLAADTAVQCRANDIEDFLTGVSIAPEAAEAVVADNDIRRRALPAGFDPSAPPESMLFAIEAGADRSRIEGNRIDLAAQVYGGILVTGRHNDVLGNRIASSSATSSLAGPIGVFVGTSNVDLIGYGDATNVALNHFTGTQLAVWVSRAGGVGVKSNMISGTGRTSGQGISVANGVETLVAENQLRDLALPLVLSDGRQNRVTSNVIATTSAGARIVREDSVELHGNLIEGAALFGISVEDIDNSATLAHNRIVNCAYAATSVPAAIIVLDYNFNADLTVESCDIVNTGVSPDRKQTTALAAYGIVAGFVPSMQIANNRILYEGTNTLNLNLEHRALYLAGGLVYSVERTSVGLGGVLITNNVFQGPGRTHLVELIHLPLFEALDIRFDKVTFANNRCDHATTAGAAASTVALFGSHMIVMGNQVKAPTPTVFAMDLGGRPRVALLGNCTTGPYTNVGSTIPTPHTNYNVVI